MRQYNIYRCIRAHFLPVVALNILKQPSKPPYQICCSYIKPESVLPDFSGFLFAKSSCKQTVPVPVLNQIHSPEKSPRMNSNHDQPCKLRYTDILLLFNCLAIAALVKLICVNTVQYIHPPDSLPLSQYRIRARVNVI